MFLPHVELRLTEARPRGTIELLDMLSSYDEDRNCVILVLKIASIHSQIGYWHSLGAVADSKISPCEIHQPLETVKCDKNLHVTL